MSDFLTIAAIGCAAVLGLAAVIRKPDTLASWCLFVGLLLLGGHAWASARAAASVEVGELHRWLTRSLWILSLIPVLWLTFSITYARGNSREFLRHFRILLILALLAPAGVLLGFRSDLVRIVQVEDTGVLVYGTAARFVAALVLLSCVLVLVNLEKTFRAAIGTVRWRVKYLFIGAGVIFAVQIYTLSQFLLFSEYTASLASIETVALLIGVLLMGVAYLRHGFGALDIYPSRSILEGSLTFALAAGYLVVVGVFAQAVVALGGVGSFPAQALLVLVGIVGLTILLLSDRLRANLRGFVARHFSRPRYDSRMLWSKLTEETVGCPSRDVLTRQFAELVSKTFEALTVRVFLTENVVRELRLSASTFAGEDSACTVPFGEALHDEVREIKGLLALKALKGPGADALREVVPVQFDHGGERVVLPFIARDRVLGVAVLCDRVGGRPFTAEEEDMLICMSGQLAAVLHQFALSDELAEGRELQAFQTMSTFFVHDLKNAANSLGLMLQNLPKHFDDPDFRQDALRALGKSAGRIEGMIEKLSSLRDRPGIRQVTTDFNALVATSLSNLNGTLDHVDLVEDFGSVPGLQLDPERIESVVTNLLVNAAEAVKEGGRVGVRTGLRGNEALLEIRDEGCGMTSAFVREQLFRPFQSTKSRGLGVGMFQTKLILEAHGGSIEVESTPHEGTLLRVLLPLPEGSDS